MLIIFGMGFVCVVYMLIIFGMGFVCLVLVECACDVCLLLCWVFRASQGSVQYQGNSGGPSKLDDPHAVQKSDKTFNPVGFNYSFKNNKTDTTKRSKLKARSNVPRN